MQGIFNYIPQINHVYGVFSVILAEMSVFWEVVLSVIVRK
jgi:hypothetical protein